MKEEFCITQWYLIASTAKVTQDLINEYVDEIHIRDTAKSVKIYKETVYKSANHSCTERRYDGDKIVSFMPNDPAKSTKALVADIATILQNTLDEKNYFYLKYAN